MLRGTARGECEIWFCCCRCFFNPLRFFNPLALWALPLYSLTGTQGERLRCIPLSPLLRFYTEYPVMLRDTAGGEVAIWFYCCCCRSFLTPPFFGHLPYILLCTTQGRRIATQSFSLYCFVAPRNATGRGRGEVAIWFCCCYCRCFLTPPFFGHLPYILRCKTQGRRIEKQPFSLYCFVAPRNATGHSRGEGKC